MQLYLHLTFSICFLLDVTFVSLFLLFSSLLSNYSNIFGNLFQLFQWLFRCYFCHYSSVVTLEFTKFIFIIVYLELILYHLILNVRPLQEYNFIYVLSMSFSYCYHIFYIFYIYIYYNSTVQGYKLHETVRYYF